MVLFLAVATPAMAVDTIPATPQARDALYDELISTMACLCGCGTTLKTCPHENCDFAVPARKEIRGFVDSGLGKDEVKAKMVALRGEAVLAQPTFTGFNIMAWVTPFIALVLVGSAVALIVRKWSVKQTVPAGTKPQVKSEEGDPYLRKMRDEFNKFEE